MAKILIADDDGHIREIVRFALQQAGHDVEEASDGFIALRLFKSQTFDLAILDILMPGEDGLELCRKIRTLSAMPLIFLSSRDDELDKVLGLELGADDYITKPFSPRELVSRVRAVLRRLQQPPTNPAAATLIKHGLLEIDIARHRCRWGDVEVVLTVTEFALLQSLATRPGIVLTRAELVGQAYGHGYFITDRTVDSHVRRIRKKLAELSADPIETVYGLGYRYRVGSS